MTTTRPAPVAAPGWRLGALYGPAVYGISAAAVALPDATRHLHASTAALAWTLTAYATGVGVGAVTAGRLIDRTGSRPVLVIAAIFLTCGAATCAAAPTLATMVTGRILLAVGSGAIIATALTHTTQLPATSRPTAMAAFGACLAGFSATAPLAGAVAAHWSWRAPLTLPALSLAAIPLCWPLTTHTPRRAPVDWPTTGLLATAATGLLLTMQTTTRQTDPRTIMITVGATGAAIAVLALRQRTHPGALLPRTILSARWFWRAAITSAGMYAGLFAAVYAAPHLLSRHGHTTMDIGLLLLPAAATGATLAWTAARATRHRPPNGVLTTAGLLLAAALCYAAWDAGTWPVIATSTIAFTAAAVTQTLLTAQTAAHTPAENRSGAIGMLTLAMFLGGGCGTALCAALWQTTTPSTAMAAVAAFPMAGAAAAWSRRRHHGQLQ
ncbi:MFS transporter [Micromonospora sp. HUAS LYJ1]|uniref:MFS transporter n=1 Tax=Micromonospora sp. HUAS LYJ1 TaxID=3061626 RepID=UPI0026741294|nr:MFS transporter [Micromonospora sp. HUAS LYJ1]WKU03493.1 MFS transporter [Micromonospora sp. HUAS LYJ1]